MIHIAFQSPHQCLFPTLFWGLEWALGFKDTEVKKKQTLFKRS